jgi:4-alpha-glucanotransferase
LQSDDFAWWVERFKTQLALFDVIRLDHFRGFEKYWEIPASAETAVEGRWVEGPGAALFERLEQVFGELPLVAEDLGVITPEVDALRQRFGLPGMKILQFAFDGGATNPYLPHQHEKMSVVYTGTHDNNTTVGWYKALAEDRQQAVLEYLGHPAEAMPWPLIRSALASVATLAVLPMQDLLALGNEHRMNTPGSTGDNWCWRFEWEQFPEQLAERLQGLVELYGRHNSK